jgi:molecular chaperone DnaK
MIQEFVKRFFGKDPHKDINPDECVALGAAVQAGVLVGEVKNIVLVDVTPLSLGVEVLGGYVEKMIERNTAVPTSGKKVFTTAADAQTAVEVHVIQGERPMAGDNKSLGKFMLTDIPPAPRGIPQIEVNFEIDSNGILNVTAKDLASGKQTGIRLTGSTNLPKTEIDKMIKESEAFAEADRKKKDEAEIKSQADSLIYTAEKTLKDIPNVDPALKGKAEDGIKRLKESMNSNDNNRMKTESESLKQILYEISSAVYAQAGAAAGGGTGGKTVWTPQGEHPVGGETPPQQSGQSGVIDADYRVEGDGDSKK